MPRPHNTYPVVMQEDSEAVPPDVGPAPPYWSLRGGAHPPAVRLAHIEVISELARNIIEVSGSENEVPNKQPPTDDAIAPRTEPVGPWRWVTDDLIEETIRVWEPRHGRWIGPEEAVLILSRDPLSSRANR
jgi:hypothetical protein